MTETIRLEPGEGPDIVVKGGTVRLQPDRVIVEYQSVTYELGAVQMTHQDATASEDAEPLPEDGEGLFPGWVYREPEEIAEYAEALWAAFVFCALWSVLIVGLSFAGLLPPVREFRATVARDEAILAIAIAPVLEEFFFRALPIWITRQITESEPVLIAVVAIISGALFGWAHEGPLCFALQGVYGLAFAALFLKCGGLRGVFLVPLTIATMSHMIWNTVVMLRDVFFFS